ncbi:MAG: nuclear transport factor 2 family protein [Novosphingobium pentaromativorans]|uniref:Nuclear transport factor 2 family protein n=2 Tax=Novosphingobium TaxID=165696 RepID=A0A2W5NWP4_9SPHN|nr:nuclear transport factor 2 family protein [Novosphingobium panipatense]PZQ56748.1 MAG: nuclear transport factor 2 family protein [Novosphingobium pentaromativorans]
MSRDDMIAFVDRLYAATGAGDWDTASAMLTDDFVAHEAEGLPMAGEYRGRTGLRDLYAKVMGLCDVAALDRIETTAGTDYAVTLLSLRFADPALPPAEICERFRFRDGKCCEIKPFYYDPAPFVAAAEAKSAAL